MASFSASVPAQAQEMVWSKILSSIRTDFPEVEQLPVDSLYAWMQAGAHPQPLLLDVRERKEYEVSHLMGAIRVDPDTDDLSFLEDVPPWTPIVAYCSVGYRSSALVDKMKKAGYSRTVNLEGSIFTWANAGYPVFRGAEEVGDVHPYNAIWGKLLEKEYRAKKPRDGN